MELSLERYRHAALQTSKAPANVPSQAAPPPTGSNQMSENDKRLQPRLLLNMFPGSGILKNDKLHLQSVMNGWLVKSYKCQKYLIYCFFCRYGVPKQTWRLIYKASTHGYSAAAFHSRCDGVAPTFVVALVRIKFIKEETICIV